jgi:hypothetical protein
VPRVPDLEEPAPGYCRTRDYGAPGAEEHYRARVRQLPKGTSSRQFQKARAQMFQAGDRDKIVVKKVNFALSLFIGQMSQFQLVSETTINQPRRRVTLMPAWLLQCPASFAPSPLAATRPTRPI